MNTRNESDTYEASRSRMVHLIRKASGMGMADVKRIMDDAENELDGDYALATLVRHAHGFAIMVRSRNPAISDEQARRKWDLEWAQSSGDMWNRIPEWNEVKRLSAEMAARRRQQEK